MSKRSKTVKRLWRREKKTGVPVAKGSLRAYARWHALTFVSGAHALCTAWLSAKGVHS